MDRSEQLARQLAEMTPRYRRSVSASSGVGATAASARTTSAASPSREAHAVGAPNSTKSSAHAPT
jgi:hypothetical protein